MNGVITTERLVSAIVDWAETELDSGRETVFVLADLYDEFGLTENEIKGIGLDWLFMEGME